MSTLTLVHATSARLHGQLLSGSHVWRSKEWLRRGIAGRRLAHNTNEGSKGGAWSEGQGRTMAVKTSRTHGEGVRSSY